ncbi:LytS/YhcK type 5TM receptor domain-containing protein [Desulfosporosinus nitroreducens]|uniref:histidine kinase n=1 Tax=Desulfosporosinus nitroreducens TaxID=2018668 RepID=A0ABT8QXQ5_9FIRM|nr:LytS/YhcK type 5TM receptor domain-containing protein [Desulfosporosinus nitroreducens]MCO1602385.1 histidine kinase [Desulfosporosinus nitroreducens]MDO0824671.1 histidine kinase [Desulfosporosinus nitroreducens]
MQLLFLMIEHIGLIVAIAFILTRLTTFRNLIDHKLDRWTIIQLSLVFGLFGIVGTYTGISIRPSTDSLLWIPRVEAIGFEEALANSRVVGVVIGGLLGGPWVGLGAGLIAGIHRTLLGGFTGLACGISTVAEGLIAGLVYLKIGNRRILPTSKAFMTGVVAETSQMLIILLVARPWESAVALVQVIALPMILANSLGIALFVVIIRTVIHEEDRIEANQAQKVLHIADQMLVNLSRGLTEESATQISKLLLKTTGVSAVSITDHEKILSHVGLGDDHHLPGHTVLTDATKKVLRTGKLYIPKSLAEIHCPQKGCPLAVAIIVPLKKSDQVIGVLKFYFSNAKQIKPVDEEVAQGLGKLLSHQLEVVDAQNHAQLIREAEIKALQAQINPHFLFNSLNTIVALVRTQPNMARKILIQLGNFFRQNLNASLHEFITLRQELDHTSAYLDIEQARFTERLSVKLEINPLLENVLLPPLTLQPLVENGIRHGLKGLEKNGEIIIHVTEVEGCALVSVKDNGIGISPERISKLLHTQIESQEGTGMALYNVNQRLMYHFGEESQLHIDSELEQGTCVWFKIPLQQGGGIA